MERLPTKRDVVEISSDGTDDAATGREVAMSRRRFLGLAAAAAVGLALPTGCRRATEDGFCESARREVAKLAAALGYDYSVQTVYNDDWVLGIRSFSHANILHEGQYVCTARLANISMGPFLVFQDGGQGVGTTSIDYDETADVFDVDKPDDLERLRSYLAIVVRVKDSMDKKR